MQDAANKDLKAASQELESFKADLATAKDAGKKAVAAANKELKAVGQELEVSRKDLAAAKDAGKKAADELKAAAAGSAKAVTESAASLAAGHSPNPRSASISPTLIPSKVSINCSWASKITTLPQYQIIQVTLENL